MTKIADLETPCVVIDLRRVEANLQRAQAHADANGYALRPHIKTHKLPRFAKRAGRARRDRHHRAEARRGRGDGRCRAHRHLRALQHRRRAKAQRGSRRSTTASRSRSPPTAPIRVAGYAATFAGRRQAADRSGRVRHRRRPLRRAVAGAGAGARAADRDVARACSFGGLMTYPPRGKFAEADRWLGDAKALLEAGGHRRAGGHLRQQPRHVAHGRRDRHRAAARHLHLFRPQRR